MNQLAAFVFLIATLPCLFLICYRDLREMRIPNSHNLYLLLVFVVLGPFVLPFDIYLWQLLYGFIGFVVAVIVMMAGIVGGGDAKMMAAITPYILPQLWVSFLLSLTIFGISAIIAHALMRLIPQLRPEVQSWKSWESFRKVPYGVPIAITFVYYLLHQAQVL